MRRTFAIIGFLLLSTWALAQLPVAQPKPSSPTVNPSLATPRATMTTFLNSMEQQDLHGARQALNLDSISFLVRDTEGNRLSRLLYAVIDRIFQLKLDGIPDKTDGPPVIIKVEDHFGRQFGNLTIQKQPTGEWLFSADTVQSLPDLFAKTSHLPSVGGFAGANLSQEQVDPSLAIRSQISPSLTRNFLFFEFWQWIGLGILLLASFLIGLVVRLLVQIIIRVRFAIWKEALERESLRGFKRSCALLAGTILWWWALPYLGLPTSANLFFTFLLKLAWVVSVAWLFTAFFDAIMDAAGQRVSHLAMRADHILIPIARKFGKFIIFAGATLMFAASLDVNVAGLVAGLGIGGLVVALAAKDSVENIFGSLTILFDMPFGIGDWIKIGDVNGTVEEINLRSTRIRTAQDSVITLPNSNLIKASVENLGSRRFRPVSFVLNVSYANPIQSVIEFADRVRKQIEANEKVRPDKTYVSLTALNEGSMGLSVQCQIDTHDYGEELQEKQEIMKGIVSAAHEAGVILGQVPWNPLTAPVKEGPVSKPTENKSSP